MKNKGIRTFRRWFFFSLEKVSSTRPLEANVPYSTLIPLARSNHQTRRS